MGTVITAPGADFRNVSSGAIMLPNYDGCMGAWLFGTSVDYSVRNRMPGRPSAVPYGTPVIGEHHIDLGGAPSGLRWLDSLIPDGPAATYLMVARTSDDLLTPATRPPFISSNPGVSSGINLYAHSDPARIRVNTYCTIADGSTQSRTSTVDWTPANWLAIGASADIAGNQLHNFTEGKNDVSASVNVSRVLAPGTIGIGGLPSSALSGTCQMRFALIFRRRLGYAEMLEIVNKTIRPLMLARGGLVV